MKKVLNEWMEENQPETGERLYCLLFSTLLSVHALVMAMVVADTTSIGIVEWSAYMSSNVAIFVVLVLFAISLNYAGKPIKRVLALSLLVSVITSITILTQVESLSLESSLFATFALVIFPLLFVMSTLGQILALTSLLPEFSLKTAAHKYTIRVLRETLRDVRQAIHFLREN